MFRAAHTRDNSGRQRPEISLGPPVEQDRTQETLSGLSAKVALPSIRVGFGGLVPGGVEVVDIVLGDRDEKLIPFVVEDLEMDLGDHGKYQPFSI